MNQDWLNQEFLFKMKHLQVNIEATTIVIEEWIQIIKILQIHKAKFTNKLTARLIYEARGLEREALPTGFLYGKLKSSRNWAREDQHDLFKWKDANVLVLSSVCKLKHLTVDSVARLLVHLYRAKLGKHLLGAFAHLHQERNAIVGGVVTRSRLMQ